MGVSEVGRLVESNFGGLGLGCIDVSDSERIELCHTLELLHVSEKDIFLVLISSFLR